MYKAHIKGMGEGCDYTIGCNHVVIDIDATCMDEAEDKMRAMFEYNEEEDRLEYDIDTIASVKIFEITQESHLGLELIRNDIHAKARKVREEEETESDMIEYERLKEKLGK